MPKKSSNLKNKTNKNNKIKNSGLSLEIVCILSICISILLIISIFFNGGGFIGKFFSSSLKGLFGVGAYILPFFIIISCLTVFFSEKKKINILKFTLSLIIIFLIMSFVHLINKDDLNPSSYIDIFKSANIFSGGILGALMGDLLSFILGKTFTYILIVFIILASLILISGKSFLNVLKTGVSKISNLFYYEYNVSEDDEDELVEEYNFEQENRLNIFARFISYIKRIKNTNYSENQITPEEDTSSYLNMSSSQLNSEKVTFEKFNGYIFDGKNKYKKIPDPIIFNLKQDKPTAQEQKILFAFDEINTKNNFSNASNSFNKDIPGFLKENSTKKNNLNKESLFNLKQKTNNIYIDIPVPSNENKPTQSINETNQSISTNNNTNFFSQPEQIEKAKNDFNDRAISNIKNNPEFETIVSSEIILDYDIPTHLEIEQLFSTPPEHFLSEETDFSHLDKLDNFYPFEQNITSYTEAKDLKTNNVNVKNIINDNSENILAESINPSTEAKEPLKYNNSIPNNNSLQNNISKNTLSNEDLTSKENNSFSSSNSMTNEPFIEKAEKQKFVNELQLDESSKNSSYEFPRLDFLNKNTNLQDENNDIELRENSNTLVKTLKSFNVNSEVIKISKGPSVTRYELSIEDGIKISKILGLDANLALSLAATSIRIEAPIPGKSAVGIEIPNKEVKSVFLSEVICDEKFQKFNSKVAFGLGKDITGNVIVTDISKMPHMLIAGSTGSGKSVCINTLITSILYKASPKDVKLIMIDPKVVELSVYNGIPHLLLPVVTEPEKASGTLNWAVSEMMERYALFAELDVRNIAGYNAIMEEKGQEKLPQIVIIIDELADLMMVAAKEVENAICRLAQLARAAGMHLIIATQRPSVDVITGLIKANIPSRIAFAVSSGTDSRTVLDSVGAEKLLGKGDMLFKSVNMNKPLRIQGAFISDNEVKSIVTFIKSNSEPDYDKNIISKIESSVKTSDGNSELSDELTDEVISFLVRKGKASTSLIQRQFRIGYNRAARIIEELEDRGIISGENGSKQRDVLMDKYQFEEYLNRQMDY